MTNLWSIDFASITCLPIAIVRLSGSQKSQIIFFLSIFSTYRYALVIGYHRSGYKTVAKTQCEYTENWMLPDVASSKQFTVVVFVNF